MAPLRILISGAGIAGPAFAFWATRLGHSCTIVERSPTLRNTGQQIDIRSHAVEVIKLMGLLQDVRDLTVHELGVRFVDREGKEQAFFPKADSSSTGLEGLSSEFEIMRGDLCGLLISSIEPSVHIRLGLTVQDFENTDDGVIITLSDGRVDSYDLLVVADGQSSSLRQKMMASEQEGSDQSRNLGVYSAYYTMSRTPDDPDLATVYVGSDKRIMCTRWHSQERGQGYLATMAHQQEIETALKEDVDTQKKLFEEIFTDAGWEANRLVESLKQADDFYTHSSVQIRISRWSRGRVVLLGDAAYAPTPLTGMGTSLALIGAYVLAGEISKAGNVCDGIETYEKSLRPLVEESQQLPIGLPNLAYPSSHLGVKAFYWFAGLASTLKLDKLGDIPFFKKSDPWSLPQYDELCSVDRTQSS